MNAAAAAAGSATGAARCAPSLARASPSRAAASSTRCAHARDVARIAPLGARAARPALAPLAAVAETAEGREAVAHVRGLRGSPNKVRRVLDAIRGMSYEEALMALEFMPYRACDDVLQVLYSAAANAKHNYGMNKSKLYISRCWANEGMLLKRPKPRARGRSNVIKKPGNHITIYVKEREDGPEAQATTAQAAPEVQDAPDVASD